MPSTRFRIVKGTAPNGRVAERSSSCAPHRERMSMFRSPIRDLLRRSQYRERESSEELHRIKPCITESKRLWIKNASHSTRPPPWPASIHVWIDRKSDV